MPGTTQLNPPTKARWLKAATLPWFRGESVGQRMFRTQAMDSLPTLVTHDRIYILPSRRGWVFVLSLLVMLTASINYNLSLGYALCFMLTGLFTSALIATYRNLAGVAITDITAGETTAGYDLPFLLTLKNQSRQRRHGIDIGNTQVTIRSDLPANDVETITFALPGIRRGLQPLGRLTLSSDYPLGLWFTWSYLHIDCSGLVFARPEQNPPPLPNGADILPEGMASRANQGEFVSVRAYQPGDSMGSIAWKTAARGMGLHTREFAVESHSSELTLSWDATVGLENTEQRISRLAAWVDLAANSDKPFAIELPGESLDMGNGPEHVRAARRLLAVYER